MSYVHVCNLMTKKLISTVIILCVTVDKINNNFLNPLQEYNSFVAPHPLKEAAGERPIVMLPLILYSDDTSGNKSKQWNKFDSWCVKLAGLRNEENMKLGNIFHISSSNKVCIISGAHKGRSVQLCGTAFESEQLEHLPYMDLSSSGA